MKKRDFEKKERSPPERAQILKALYGRWRVGTNEKQYSINFQRKEDRHDERSYHFQSEM